MHGDTQHVVANIKLKKKPSKGAWVMIVATIVFIVIVFASTILGYLSSHNPRAQMEATFLNDNEMVQPIYRYIKQYDPETFSALMDEAVRLEAARKPGATVTSDPSRLVFGQRTASKYFRQASDDILNKHFTMQVVIMKELNAIDPLLVCKQSFPQIYGVIQRDELLKAKSLPEFNETFRLLIESGARGKSREADKEAPAQLRAFGADFKRRFPKEQAVLQDAFASKPVKDVPFLAKSIILFNEELQKLPIERAIMVRRFIHGSS